MRQFKLHKLVRDNILGGMKENKHEPKGVRELNNDEFIKELVRKLEEESSEMQNSVDPTELQKELADIVEIVRYLQKALKISDEELEVLIQKKREKNGGFDKKVFVESVNVQDDDYKFIDYYLNEPERFPEIL